MFTKEHVLCMSKIFASVTIFLPIFCSAWQNLTGEALQAWKVNNFDWGLDILTPYYRPSYWGHWWEWKVSNLFWAVSAHMYSCEPSIDIQSLLQGWSLLAGSTKWTPSSRTSRSTCLVPGQQVTALLSLHFAIAFFLTPPTPPASGRYRTVSVMWLGRERAVCERVCLRCSGSVGFHA